MIFSDLGEQYYDWLHKIVWGEWESREISRSIGCSCTYIIALIFRTAKWTSVEQKMV